MSDSNTYVFAVAGKEGNIFLITESSCEKIFNIGSSVLCLLSHVDKSWLVVLSAASMLGIYAISSPTKVSQVSKSKVSLTTGTLAEVQACWIGNGLLATCAGEPKVRVWDLINDENYVLVREENTEPFITLGFNRTKRLIVAASEVGTIAFWKFVGSSDTVGRGTKDWEYYAECKSPEKLTSMRVGPLENLISVHCLEHSYILHETVLRRRVRSNIMAVQISADSLLLESFGEVTKCLPVKTQIKIKHMDMNKDQLAISNGKTIELYEFKFKDAKETIVRLKSSTELTATSVAIHEEGIFAATANKIEVYNFKGTKKQTLPFVDLEGNPIIIDIEADYIAAVTSTNQIKFWQVSGREAKQVGQAKPLFSIEEKQAGYSQQVCTLKLSMTGTKAAILCKTVFNNLMHEPSSKLYVYDMFTERVDVYDFKSQGKYPTGVYWDDVEPKQLAVETVTTTGDEATAIGTVEICTLFATSDYGILLQDSFTLDKSLTGLGGISTPSFLFIKKDISVASVSCIERRSLRDFEGINVKDNVTRDALMNFSYYLAIGNMEEAYKAVKTIKDVSVWQNMAQMCVKTKKMEVAEICISNMEDAKAAHALRDAKLEDEPEVQTAMLAIQLGLIEEAERLYKSCKRFDLLNKMYQSLGKWEKALETAEKHDRIHLKSTHFSYAKYLQLTGNSKQAITHYEQAKTLTNIPKMLYDANAKQLQAYVSSHQDSAKLVAWWAQYCEGNGVLDEALKAYSIAKDHLAIVRLLCFKNKLKHASEVVNHSGDKAAAFYLAKQLEERQMFNEAIQFFSHAGSFKNAIRIAKLENMDQQVLNIALQSSSDIMLDAAQYFDERGIKDKAVLLYQKSGNVARAIESCFNAQLFDVLSQIADNLGKDVSSDVLCKCGEFFLQHGKHEKAVSMFITAQEFDRALEICIEKKIKLTEEMAEQMTPKKAESDEDKQNRVEQCLKIAKVAAMQSSFAVAAKKYVQAGDRVKGMKALIKSGDTEKIIMFAYMSKMKELYILAANYLQNLNWHEDPEYMKSIITFYTKAKAWDSLATFYETCSEMEIDSFRNYEKALSALKEALRHMSKSNASQEKTIMLKNRIYLIDKFLVARSMVKTDPQEMVKLCNQLLSEQNVNEAIRVGDIYGLLVDLFYSQGNKEQAYEVIQRMNSKGIRLESYLNMRVVAEICKALGVKQSSKPSNDTSAYEESYEEVDEAVD